MFVMNVIKKNWAYFCCVVLGLFNFILFAIPYVAAFVETKSWVGDLSYSEGISGYRVMDMWDGGFSGVMSSLLQIFILILGIVLLVLGVLGLLKAKNICKVLPDKLGNVESKKAGEIGLLVMTILNVLLLVFLIIVTVQNTEGDSSGRAGIKLSAGIFLAIIFGAAAYVGGKLIEKKANSEPATETAEEKAEETPVEEKTEE